MKKYLVIGNPIKHSLSPKLHNYWIKENNIDAVLPTMGGQTALNLCIEADEKGIWDDFNVEIIGVDIEAINITEDLSLIHI